MLQKEFEERIGRSVSNEEFVEANAMYMLSGDAMDKDVFCREWQKIGGSALVKGLFETAYSKDQALQEQKLMVNECQEMISDAADKILEVEAGLLGGETAEHTTERLENIAGWLVGRKQVVLRKLKAGMTLTESEREYIINNLK